MPNAVVQRFRLMKAADTGERTFTSANTTPQVTIITYQHDDKPNPFYGLPYDALNPEAINRNNIKYDNTERVYNDQGLLTNLSIDVIHQGPRVSYTYEAY